MTTTLHTFGLHEPFAARLADLVLDLSPDAAAGDLEGGLVLLPSVRACASLRHALLEAVARRHGREAVLLPEIATPRQLVAQLAGRLGLTGVLAAAPPDELRALLLAVRLPRLKWVRRHPESAAGLAAELVRTFDELRRAAGEELLADGAPAALAGLSAEARALVAADLSRLREAWALYRETVPADAVDVLLETAARLDRDGWPGPRGGPTVAAGFAELDRMTARILRAALARDDGRGGQDGHLVETSAEDDLSRAFTDTFTDPRSPGHPLAPARRVRSALLRGDRPRRPAVSGQAARPDFFSCADPEDESRTVAALVCELLRQSGADTRIAVATYDPSLARRVGAQLRDAGVDYDDTAGRPLSALPAGRFAHALVQCAVGGVRPGPLLEALTHPYADLSGGRGAHSRRVLLLEGLALRGEAPPLDLDDYRRRARRQDEAYRELHPDASPGLADFVAAIASALAPLLAPANGPATWARRLDGLRRAWTAFAPGQPLRAATPAHPPGGRDDRPEDLVALGDLLDRLARLAARGALGAGEVPLAEFAATLDRLLAAETVRPRRAALRPVQIMGLLEARLERFDLLVLAGLNEDVFPGRVPRPLFLGEAARRELALPLWRDESALRGDLFLRLLHGADRVALTWSRERDGQPALPSPFVERLTLGLEQPPTAATARRPLFRRARSAGADIQEAQNAFAREPLDVPAHATPLPLRRASHSALAKYRGCPYRYLLERGLGLAEPEEVVESFRRLDHGTAVHECLRRLLAPDGEGLALLRCGDGPGALACLRRIAQEEFGQAAVGLPQRRLWEESFLNAAPAIVAREIERLAAWEPWALEAEFRLPLGELRAWLADEPAAGDAPAAATADGDDIVLTGKIDRVDVARADPARAAVIDYKTGSRVPTKSAVEAGEEPQLVLYAIAVERGLLGAAPGGSSGMPPRVTEAGYYLLAGAEVGLKPRFDFATGKAGRAPLRAGALRLLADTLAAADPARPFPLIPAHRDEAAKGEPPCLLCPYRGICRVDERELPWPTRARLTAGRRPW